MPETEFCRSVLTDCERRLIQLRSRHSTLKNALLLPSGETIRIPTLQGVHPIGNRPPPERFRFGADSVATKLPPIWPPAWKPSFAVCAEQETHPFRPLTQEPYRVHLFFDGDRGALGGIVNVVASIIGLRSELATSIFGKDGKELFGFRTNDILGMSTDCIHGDTETVVDAWFTTLHWWAWQTTDTTLKAKTVAVVGTSAYPADPSTQSMAQRTSLSILEPDVYEASIQMTRLLIRFLDVPPVMDRVVVYPPTSPAIPSKYIRTVQEWKHPFDPRSFSGWEISMENRYGQSQTISVSSGNSMSAVQAAEHLAKVVIEKANKDAEERGGQPPNWKITAMYANRIGESAVSVFDDRVKPPMATEFTFVEMQPLAPPSTQATEITANAEKLTNGPAAAKSSPQLKSDIFVSYSHKDKDYLAELKQHLKPLIRGGKLSAWNDTQLKAGNIWLKKIEDARDAAKTVVMLVSKNFLASDFINEHEFDPVIAKAVHGDVRVVWVLVGPCNWKHTPLKDIQAVNSTSNPLALLNEHERDVVWVSICEALLED